LRLKATTPSEVEKAQAAEMMEKYSNTAINTVEETEKAKAFRENSPAEAVKEHPQVL
jgi:hypothetical protein